MDESSARTLALYDEAIPALPALLGNEAVDLLQAAVAPRDGRIIAARASQVSWQPGHSLNVVYQVRVNRPGGDEGVDTQIVASTGPSATRGGMQLEDTMGNTVSLWGIPHDPELPGLAIAMDPARARGLLDSLDCLPGAVTPALRAYRPTRRAVIELTTPAQRLFVKIVSRSRVGRLHTLHDQMARHLPVPKSYGWSEEHGLVVLQALPGFRLRRALMEPNLAAPDARHLSDLLDLIPRPLDERTAPAQADSAPHLAPLIRMLAPECKDVVERLVGAFAADRPTRPEVPVHGDLHEAQVMVQDGRFTGILDIDTAGMGERMDDWATLLAHLALLAEAPLPAARERIQSYARRVMAIADQQTDDPARLRLRTAAVIFGLASGPFRAQVPGWVAQTRARIDLASRWAEAAAQSPKMRISSDASKGHLI